MNENSPFRSVMIAVLAVSLVLGLGFLAFPYLPDFSAIPAHPEMIAPAPYPLISEQPTRIIQVPLTQDGTPIFNRIYQNNSVLIEELYFLIHEFGLKADRGAFTAGDREFAAQWYYIAVDWHEAYSDELWSVFCDSHPPVAITPESYCQKFIDLDVAFHDAIRELNEYNNYPDAKLVKENEEDPWNVLLGYFDLLQDIHDEMVKLSSYYPQGFRLIDVAEAELLSTFLEFRYANMLEDMEQFKCMDRAQGEAMEELQMAFQDDIAELKKMGDRSAFLLQRENARRQEVDKILEYHGDFNDYFKLTLRTDITELTLRQIEDNEWALWPCVDELIEDIGRREELRYTDAEFELLDKYLTAIVDRLMDLQNEREFRSNQDDSMTDENLEMRK